MVQSNDIKALEVAMINILRAKEGLPSKSAKHSQFQNVPVLGNPDRTVVSSLKTERGFVYLNMNGGDSWGYYHPVTSPEIIYNFKGEDNYRTKDLDPDYYHKALINAKQAKSEEKKHLRLEETRKYNEHQTKLLNISIKSGDKFHCVFRDSVTDQYYIGYYDTALDHNTFHATSSKDRARDYLVQHGVTPPEIFPTWNYQFRPETLTIFDLVSGFVNQFTPTTYMKAAATSANTKVPATIRRVIMSALGNDRELYEHFLNWLAVIFQYRTPTQTAWVLQGTTGTGKGVLFNYIIKPLLGEEHCKEVTLATLEEQFNHHLEKCLVLYVDEVDTDQIKHVDKLIAKVKNMITEPTLAIRAMRSNLKEVPSHINIVMASNRPNSMRIEDNDRRFNICPRQENPLLSPSENGLLLIKSIKNELQDFANYLHSVTADKSKSRIAVDNEPKRLLKTITQTGIEQVADALKTGDLAYFIEHQPQPNATATVLFDNDIFDLNHNYKDTLKDAIISCGKGNAHILRHACLFSLFKSLLDNIPSTKVTLSKRLGHIGIHVKPHTTGGSSIRGYRVKWSATSEELARWSKSLDIDYSVGRNNVSTLVPSTRAKKR